MGRNSVLLLLQVKSMINDKPSAKRNCPQDQAVVQSITEDRKRKKTHLAKNYKKIKVLK